MKSTRGIVLVVFTVALALVATDLIIHNTYSKSALNQFKAELRARGEKLTITALVVPPTTDPDCLAARRVLGGSGQVASPVLLVNLSQFIAPGRARVAWRGELDVAPGYARFKMPVPTWDTFLRQVDQAEPALASARQALENVPPDTGWVWQDKFDNLTNWPGRSFVRDRNLAQGLYNAAIADLHRNDLDAAITNLHALTELTGINRNEPVLVSQMIRIAIAQIGLDTSWEALQAPGWDEPRLAGLQQDWERVSFIEGLERSFETERAFNQVRMTAIRESSVSGTGDFLSLMQSSFKNTHASSGWSFMDAMTRLSDSVWNGGLIPLTYRLTSMNEDELVQLRFSTKGIDAVRLIQQGRPWPEVLSAFTNFGNEFEATLRQDRLGRLMVSRRAIPNFTRAALTEVQTDARRKMTITAIAIKRYQLKNGTTPATLAALTPEFLASVPIDPMSAKPLCYHLKLDGTFALYSTGEDGRDDGGDPTPVNPKETPGLWNGHDAVWPAAATPEEQATADLPLPSVASR